MYMNCNNQRSGRHTTTLSVPRHQTDRTIAVVLLLSKDSPTDTATSPRVAKNCELMPWIIQHPGFYIYMFIVFPRTLMQDLLWPDFVRNSGPHNWENT